MDPEVHRSALQLRLTEAGLLKAGDRTARVSQAEEFLVHGLRYVSPAPLGAGTRGIPAAWAAEPLVRTIAGSALIPLVWPHAHGQVRGVALQPIHRYAINAALHDARLGELLAVTDAIRAGDARIRDNASRLLSQRLDEVRDED